MTVARITVAEILRGSLELLEDPDHWTQGTLARDSIGKPWDPAACRWCRPAIRKLREAVTAREGCRMYTWHFNDAKGRRHSEVLDVIRRAIELAEAEEAA